MWKVAKDADTACRPPSDAACGLTTDWQSKFDYVFLRGVSPLAQRVRHSESSDHNLVYADVDLT
jgi:endonuclease/exonuclease/phosphatase (EEP) superfamily protein YafD